uniref:Uncharacterized protein n=2 Tax=Picea TaxID=3328 RepID=A0A101M1I0_PICGL|nr:hypothetical protein ABT39_MTgene3719 [Picea glauca]QHR90287.1 hypothetical protein Q903MT_gene4310 [Picea sitchensis]
MVNTPLLFFLACPLNDGRCPVKCPSMLCRGYDWCNEENPPERSPLYLLFIATGQKRRMVEPRPCILFTARSSCMRIDEGINSLLSRCIIKLLHLIK